MPLQAVLVHAVPLQAVPLQADAHASRPYLAVAVVALVSAVSLAVILRTAIASLPRTRTRARTGPTPSTVLDDYGLLRTVALVESLETGWSVRALLATGDIRATVATGGDGLVRVLVFPAAYERARNLVSWAL